MTDFLPDGYEAPQGGSSYLKLQQGENKLRILSKPIIGWLDWKDKVPHRFGFKQKPEKPFDPSKPIKHFWAMIVFDYSDSQVKVLEITQQTIQKTIQDLAANEDWGSPSLFCCHATNSTLRSLRLGLLPVISGSIASIIFCSGKLTCRSETYT